MTTRISGPAVAALTVLAAWACAPDDGRPADERITADTVDRKLESPGTILRFGPATPEEIERSARPPVVEGDEGQVSIHDGYFVREPCARPLQVDASLEGDTILVRVVSGPDTTRTGTCQEAERPTGYAVLVGQFEAEQYAVRVIHDGDRSRSTPLDTVYENITVMPRER